MTALYRAPGSVLSFPIPIHNTLGQLADPTAQSVLLFSDEVAQATQGEGVSIRKVADGLFFADANSATEGMESFFANGKRIRAASRQVSIDSENGFGDFLDGVYLIGVEPGSAGNGSKIVTLVVIDDDEIPILGIRVTAYDANGRFAGVGVSDASGEIVLHLMPGEYDLSSPSVPGGWSMANPMQSITVTDDGPNAFEVEFLAMPITLPPIGRATGWIVALDKKQQPVAGESVFIVAIRPPETGVNANAGLTPPTEPWEEVSIVGGLVEFVGLLVGWTYRIWGGGVSIGEDEQAEFTVREEYMDAPNGFPISDFIRRVAA